jgi:gas vesicle protein
MNSGKVFLGLLAGFTAGAVLGVLFAPDKGSVTRKKIAKTGQEYADSLGSTFNEFIESVTEQFHALHDEATQVADDIKAKAQDVKAKAS